MRSNFIGLAVLFVLLASCTGQPPEPAAEPETVFSDSPATWFEDALSRASVSSGGVWALYQRRTEIELVNLTGARADSDLLRGGLDDVQAAVFFRDGEIARLGRRGEEQGWFLPGSNGPVLSPLPQDAQPQWSPDGSRLAFVRSSEEARTLHVGTLDRQRNYGFAGPILGLVWSPGGDAVYVRVRGEIGLSSIVRVAADTGEKVTVADGLDALGTPDSLGVSPDGKRLYVALASSTAPDPEERHRPGVDRDLDIYEIEIESGERRVRGQTPGDDIAPVVANGFLYWTANEVRDEVAVLPVEGGEAQTVAEYAQIPNWSADGKKIAFTYGGWRLADWALNMDAAVVDVDGEGRAVSEAAPIVTGYHEDFTPAWSPDGKWIAYHSHRAAKPVPPHTGEGTADDVYLRRPDAPMEEEIRLTDFGWEVGTADWSPNGRQLVFDSWERGSAGGAGYPWVVTIDPATGTPVRVERLAFPRELTSATWVAWSPKGDEIAIEDRIDDKRRAIWVIALDGRPPAKLLEYPATTYSGLDWTPDGETIVYAASGENRYQLFALPRKGGEPKQLTHDTANLLHPQVSPDGRWIAATRIQWTKRVLRVPLD